MSSLLRFKACPPKPRTARRLDFLGTANGVGADTPFSSITTTLTPVPLSSASLGADGSNEPRTGPRRRGTGLRTAVAAATEAVEGPVSGMAGRRALLLPLCFAAFAAGLAGAEDESAGSEARSAVVGA